MLDHFLRDDAAVQRMRASPLGAQLDSFAAVLSALGYARASIRDRLWTVAAFGRWLKRRGLSATGLTRDAAAAFLRRPASRNRVHRGAAATLRLFFEHLEQQGLIPASPCHDPTPMQALQARYEAYLRNDRGLSPVTGPRHRCVLRRFLHSCFGDGPIDVRALTAADVTRYVVAQTPTRSPASAQLHASTLRSFLRFLWQAGDLASDLTAAIPPVRRWRLVDVPKYLPPGDVTRVLRACDRTTSVGAITPSCCCSLVSDCGAVKSCGSSWMTSIGMRVS
jgi:site-specific recombinase XerD